MACSMAAAMSSSVTKVVQLRIGLIIANLLAGVSRLVMLGVVSSASPPVTP